MRPIRHGGDRAYDAYSPSAAKEVADRMQWLTRRRHSGKNTHRNTVAGGEFAKALQHE
jgi:hypothetical protein